MFGKVQRKLYDYPVEEYVNDTTILVILKDLKGNHSLTDVYIVIHNETFTETTESCLNYIIVKLCASNK